MCCIVAAQQLWYMFCEKCHEKAIKVSSSIRQTRAKCIAEMTQYERAEQALTMDHYTMKDNAVFLLDLAPLTNSGI